MKAEPIKSWGNSFVLYVPMVPLSIALCIGPRKEMLPTARCVC